MFLDNKTRSTISTGLLIGYVAWDLAAPYFFGKEDTPPESNKDKNPAVRTMQGDVGYITQGLGISSEKGLRLLDDLKAADTDPQKMTDIWNAYQAGKYGEISSDAFVRDLGDRSITAREIFSGLESYASLCRDSLVTNEMVSNHRYSGFSISE